MLSKELILSAEQARTWVREHDLEETKARQKKLEDWCKTANEKISYKASKGYEATMLDIAPVIESVDECMKLLRDLGYRVHQVGGKNLRVVWGGLSFEEDITKKGA